MVCKLERFFLIVFMGIFSSLLGMEEQTPQARLFRLYESMHSKMSMASSSMDDYYNRFINVKHTDLDNLSVYHRIKKLIEDQNDIILKEIGLARDLIVGIKACDSDVTYAKDFRPSVTEHLDRLNFITGIFINMAILPVCAYIQWVSGFDEVLDLLDTPRFKSDAYGDTIKDLIYSMKETKAKIYNVIDSLLEAALSKEKDADERRKLEEELNRRQQEEEQRRLEEEARAMAEEEAEHQRAEQARLEAEERANQAAEIARKAKEEADRAEQAERAILEEDARRAKQAAEKAEEERQKAELENQRRKRLAEEAKKMDKEALKQVRKGVKGLPNVKALLEKIKEDVQKENFQALQDDISKETLEFKGRKIPGLLKSLNEYLSNGTVGLFIQIFKLIKGALEIAEIKNTQKSLIFNSLKAKLTAVPEFYQLVNKSGIIGSQQKDIYKKGAVEFENLIRLIDAYKSMCLATKIQGVRTEETIKQELFNGDSLDTTVGEIRKKIKAEQQAKKEAEIEEKPEKKTEPEIPPDLPPREDPIKKSLIKLKGSLQELRDKSEILRDKLGALAQRIGE